MQGRRQGLYTAMRFVKNFTPLFSPNFNSLGDNNTKKLVKNEDIYTAGKDFKLPPAKTNLTSACILYMI